MAAISSKDVARALFASIDASAPRAPGPALPAWTPASAAWARAQLQRCIYGPVPSVPAPRIVERHFVDVNAACGGASGEAWTLAFGEPSRAEHAHLLLALPAGAPRALILAQAFSRGAAPLARLTRALAGAGDVLAKRWASDHALRLALGRHIHAPPFASVLAEGVGLAVFCPAQIAADHPERGAGALEQWREGGGARPGVLALWAALTIAVRAALAADTRIGSTPIIALGHSRHGKAALLAAAFDPAFAGVIAHQSGRFGASLTEGGAGESVAQIARAYPHWFGGDFDVDQSENLKAGVDQHLLLALVAPRPLLLGAAARDHWADPLGAWRGAHAASDAYRSFGLRAVAQPTLARPDFSGELSLFMRDGGHGVDAADWKHFLAFIRAKFPALAVEAGSTRRFPLSAALEAHT